MRIDENIIHRVNTGDQEAFAALYDAYYAYLCSTATVYIHNPEAAKEIVNDIFLKVWRMRSSLRSPVHPYLMTALRNSCLNYLRTNAKALRGGVEWLLEFSQDRVETFTPLSYTEVNDLVSTVRRVSDDFPPRCREIFHLHFFSGLTPKEISKELSLSPSTVRVQLKIAMDRIRAAIGGTYGKVSK